ncbi:hypothetical protein BJ138DRAFT_1163929 [Hygrophoropsis aurantiaca]|uniref:Uncharacterized protein n=1 Tax=Hygrophoropsis aurantiaca TaxID=72124 RepID=A0ACB7ZYN8_9AGAM|nr:hypothetical protein BJ138DRAFT_1163929 [Hygrophoropsis aurantiaca]
MVPVYVVGGYIMSRKHAQAWAEKKFSSFVLTKEDFLAFEIRRQLGAKPLVIPWPKAVRYHRDDMILFITMQQKFNLATCPRPTLRENDTAKLHKQALFGGMEDELEFLKDLKFVTVIDPYGTHP